MLRLLSQGSGPWYTYTTDWKLGLLGCWCRALLPSGVLCTSVAAILRFLQSDCQDLRSCRAVPTTVLPFLLHILLIPSATRKSPKEYLQKNQTPNRGRAAREAFHARHRVGHGVMSLQSSGSGLWPRYFSFTGYYIGLYNGVFKGYYRVIQLGVRV